MKLMIAILCQLFTLALSGQINLPIITDMGENSPNAKFICSIPFHQLTGGIIIIRACVGNNSDSLNFVLDTGCSGISLDSQTCVILGLHPVKSDKYIRGIGAFQPALFVRGLSLNLPGTKLNNMDYHVINYETLTEVYGIKIDGIIGYSLFSRYMVKVDYDSQMISLYKPGNYAYPKGGRLIKLSSSGFIPIIEAPISNKVKLTSRFYFDMGAGLCLLFSERFVKDSSILSKLKRRKKIIETQVQGLVGKMSMRLTTIKEIHIAGYAFRNIPTYIFDDISDVTSYPKLGGLVGNDLLRRFNTIVNYPANEIFLIPNTHFNDYFDYSYTGMIIYYIDNHVEITDIIKGSPADKAGFLPGDIIYSVGNDFSNSMQVYRELLKKVNTKVKLTIKRDSVLIQKILPIKSIR